MTGPVRTHSLITAGRSAVACRGCGGRWSYLSADEIAVLERQPCGTRQEEQER